MNCFNGPLRRCDKNPRYFTDDSGKAIYLTGSHTWAVMQEMWPENEPRHNMDFAGFLQMMYDNNHNFMRFWQFSLRSRNCPANKHTILYDPLPYERVGTEPANDGLPKYDLTRFNESYFQRLRERIIAAGEKGIYASVMMFEAWSIKWSTPDQDAWLTHAYNPQNNINGITDDPIYPNGKAWGVYTLNCKQIKGYMEAFVRKVIDTVNDLDNVLYEICNEIPHTQESMEWQEHMCTYIREYEKTKPKQHMIGITSEGGSQDNSELWETSADWISPSNGFRNEYRYNPPAANGSKVIVSDTDHLWGHGGEVKWVWKSFTRGMNVLFMDPWEPFPGDLDWWQDGDLTRNSRYYHVWDDLRRNMGYARALAQCFDLTNMIPDEYFCTSTYTLSNKNKQYICYFPAGGYEGFDLRETDCDFQVEWLEPATGITYKAESLNIDRLKGEKRVALHPPFEGQAVLLLFKERNYLQRSRSIYYGGK